MKEQDDKVWAIVPAAGVGARMSAGIKGSPNAGADTNPPSDLNTQPLPKQYLKLLNKTVIEHSIDALLSVPDIHQVLVALSEHDVYWGSLPIAQHSKVKTVLGGAERVLSVLAALHSLDAKANPDDWVLVHDAARPCVSRADIEELIRVCVANNSGSILAAPVVDTIKRVDTHQKVVDTVDRRQLFHALTPQMFRYSALLNALESAVADNVPITDEASAFEAIGVKPGVVIGARNNIKITYPEDLLLAEFYLTSKSVSD